MFDNVKNINCDNCNKVIKGEGYTIHEDIIAKDMTPYILARTCTKKCAKEWLKKEDYV
jgi:hypothetical protein